MTRTARSRAHSPPPPRRSRPFQVAADRVAAPFRDAYGWGQGLVDARSDADRLQRENETLRQQYARARLAEQENARLRSLLQFKSGPRFPEGFNGVASEVIYRPPGAYAQTIVIAVGARRRDPRRRPGRDRARARRDGEQDQQRAPRASRSSPTTRARSRRPSSAPRRPASFAAGRVRARRSGSSAFRRRPSSRSATRWSRPAGARGASRRSTRLGS